MSDIYTFEQKKKLAERINNIHNKTILKNIRIIIIENNPDIIMKKVNNGYLSYFQNYTNDTYIKINIYLSQYAKQQEKSKDLTLSTESPSIPNENTAKYSNKDKRIIKRQRYEETIFIQRTTDLCT
jgi:hypothetical protein